MSMMADSSIVYSIVIPFLDEELVLPTLIRRLDGVLDELDGRSEVIFVDDGSSDRSASIVSDKVQGRPAISSDLAVAQLRASGRHHRRNGHRLRSSRDRHGCRLAGSAGTGDRNGRQVEGGI